MASSGGDHARRVEVPFGQETISGQAAMKRTGGDAVKIRQIFPADGAEAIQIEIGVANFERIKGPADGAETAAQGFFALKKFQHSPDATITIVSMDSGHMGMQIRNTVANASDGESKTSEANAVKGTEDLATGIVGNDKDA